jgi:periplasmic protein TonB
MALRCLLFSSDEGTAEPIRQVLAGLGVEGEYCSEAVVAVDKVTNQNFQIVIIDWDKQPEAGQLLTAARERKASERPLTLAIVSDDGSVPKALQAGANSILRKPLLINPVKDTLTTARDLLRAKQESAQAAAAGASAGSSPMLPAREVRAEETRMRPGELLGSTPSVPIGQFVTKSHAPEFVPVAEPVASPRELRPVAAPVKEDKPAPPPASASPLPPDGPKGLEWYLRTRAVTPSPDPAYAQTSPGPAKSDLLRYDQMPAPSSPSAQPKSDDLAGSYVSEPKPNHKRLRESKRESKKEERKKEAELFAYMAGEKGDSREVRRSKSRLGKGSIIAALVLAGCAILAAPQAPWHSKIRGVWGRGQQAMRGWLNPQPVTPVQAPVAHENFGRAGDEYKMPVEENIPDATTDPSQIQVVPVIDPTAKKPNNDATSAEQPSAQPDGAGEAPSNQIPPSAVQIPDKQPSPETMKPATGPATGGAAGSTVASAPVGPVHSDSPAATPTTSPAASAPAQPAPPKKRPPHDASPSGNVPSSLKSQIASMTPNASGNKAPEAAMDSIEPVAVPEAAERALLTEQPALAYPANAREQQGTVVLQVLIGRDGTVQDAKFLQGSLAFAKAAIDGVKQWKFKPYSMNGRAVSVQTLLTISFKPES